MGRYKENMEDDLKYTFSNVNDWLRFAEAKSAILIGGCATMCIAIGQSLIKDEVSGLLELYLTLMVIQLLFGLLISLISFVPSLNIIWLFRSGEKSDRDNLLFFEHISKYTPTEYLVTLNPSESSYKFSKMEKYLAQQIVANSVIARKKYILFKAAIWLVVSGLVTPVFAFILWMIKN